ncbi:hypothetical protein V7S43_008536 [Phytophthora oleae]|uniref:Uncharacterized protein n=1 Tax=Phytophthora oleae TaxID=2107226 RepID=A0ABD3FH79_9STRA
MGQPTESPTNATATLSSSPLAWDGKCQSCRKLMSRCVCFQESENDVGPLTNAATQVTADVAETRPLWNALRKMHRTSAGARLTLVQPPTSSHPSSKEHHRKRSEALPPLSAPTSSSRHLHRRSDARLPQSSRRGSREPRRESTAERPSTSRKDRLQRAGIGISSSSHSLKKDVKDEGIMRAVRSTSSIDKHKGVSVSRPKEKLSYGPEEGSDDENDETVWEL